MVYDYPFNFLFVIEILGQNLRNNSKIKGIVINGQTFTSGQFADNTTLGLKYEQETLNEAISTLTEFER